MRKYPLVVTLLTSSVFMIIISEVFSAIGLHWWIVTGFPLHTIINGIISALVGLFLSFRIVLKIEYSDNLKKGLLFGILTSLLFFVYTIIDVSVNYSDYFQTVPFNWWLQTYAVGIFLSSLIGCLVGFIGGGSKLQNMPAPPPRVSVVQPTGKEELSPLKAGAGIILFLLIGGVIGYFGGHIIWIIFGQIQIALGVFPPYAALTSPPLVYQIGWTVLGALSFPFKILPTILK